MDLNWVPVGTKIPFFQNNALYVLINQKFCIQKTEESEIKKLSLKRDLNF